MRLLCHGDPSLKHEKQLCHKITDESAAGKGQKPGKGHFPTTPQWTEDSFRAAPTPIMAVVLVWGGAHGNPARVETRRLTAPARSAENP